MAPDIWLRTTKIMKKEIRCRRCPSDQQQGIFYMHYPTDRITHIMAFGTPRVEHWLEREIA